MSNHRAVEWGATTSSSHEMCDSGLTAHVISHKAAITTTAEIVTILCYTGAFTLRKENKYAQWMVHSDLALADETYNFISDDQPEREITLLILRAIKSASSRRIGARLKQLTKLPKSCDASFASLMARRSRGQNWAAI